MGFIESLYSACSHNTHKCNRLSCSVAINPYFRYSLEYLLTFALAQAKHRLTAGAHKHTPCQSTHCSETIPSRSRCAILLKR